MQPVAQAPSTGSLTLVRDDRKKAAILYTLPLLRTRLEMTFCIGALKDFDLTILKGQYAGARKKKEKMISTAIAVGYEGPGQDYYLEVPRKDLLDFSYFC